MELESISPKPALSRQHLQHQVCPYLLRGVTIERPYQVWMTDITYIRVERRLAYLLAVIGWYTA